jgi:tetratricopeptide (TPR) repeat protein
VVQLLVTGPLELRVNGALVPIPSKRARALLGWLAVTGRAATRAELAALLWGEGRLQNLRQELYRLRQLPASEAWLLVDDDRVKVVGVEVSAPPERGPFFDGLDDAGGPELLEWVHAQRAGGPVGDLERQLLRVLSLDPSLDPDVVAAVLGVGRAPLAELWQHLVDAGDLPGGQIRPALAAAVRRELSEAATRLLHREIARCAPERAGPHLEAAGDLDAAAEATLRQARADDDGPGFARAAALSAVHRADALWASVDHHRRHGDADAARAAADALRAHAVASQDPSALVISGYVSAAEALRDGRLDDAARAARELAHDAADDDQRSLAAAAEAAVWARRGDLDGAARALDRALPWRRSPRVELITRNAAGAIAGYRGALDDAEAHHREALRLARQARDRGAIVALLSALAANDERREDFTAAAERVDEALRLVDERSPLAAHLRHTAAVVALRRGRLGAVRQWTNRLLDDARRDDLPLHAARALHLRAALESELGRPEEAVRWGEKAAAAAVADPATLTLTRFNLARDQRAPDAALAAALDAVDALGQPTALRDALAERGLGADDPAVIRACLARLDVPDPGPLLRMRSTLLRAKLGDPPPPHEGPLPELLGAWRLAAVDRAAYGPREAVDQALAAWIDRAADGLLPAQAEAFRARVEVALRQS